MDLWSFGGVTFAIAALLAGIGVGFLVWGRPLRACHQRLGTSEAQRVSLSHRMDASSSELTQLRARLVGTRVQYDKLLDELRSKDSSLADLTVDLRKAEAELQGRDSAWGELRASLAPMGGAEVATTQDLLTIVTDLRHNLEARTAEISEAEQELAAMRDRIDSSTETTGDLLLRLTDLEGLIEVRDRRITDLEDELERIRVLEPEPIPDPLPVKATRVGTAPADHADDLKRIRGIGPVLEKTLNGLGISTWEQIADFTKDDIEHVAAALGTFPDRIVRDNWMESARSLLPHDHADGEDRQPSH